jgi:hypothetical protein
MDPAFGRVDIELANGLGAAGDCVTVDRTACAKRQMPDVASRDTQPAVATTTRRTTPMRNMLGLPPRGIGTCIGTLVPKWARSGPFRSRPPYENQ